MMMMSIEKLRNELRGRNMRVTFTKKDGSNRVMVCTTASDLIPEEKLPKGDDGNGPKRPENIVTVFDLEKEDWRSFDFNSVNDIEYSEW